MASGRVACFVILALLFTITESKVFTRCQLTRELLKNNFPRTFLSNWVCLIEQESERNTATMVTKTPRRKYYGLFQKTFTCKRTKYTPPYIPSTNTCFTPTRSIFRIGSEWCKEGRKGGKCDISCEALLDDDIKDDSVCAMKVFELEGFKYWSRWEARCKGQTLPDIEKCPDWQHPPTIPRASPPRDKRTIRGKRSQRFLPYLISRFSESKTVTV